MTMKIRVLVILVVLVGLFVGCTPYSETPTAPVFEPYELYEEIIYYA